MTESKTYRVRSDGLEIVAEEFGLARGPAFVFAHGLTSCRAHSRRQFASLADRCRVIVFDQRGHGDSTPVHDPALYDANRMAGDMAAVMDHLGIEQAVVGGESMGAATSLRFALNWPQRARALVQCIPALADVPNPGCEVIHDMGTAMAAQGMDAFAAANEQVMLAGGASPEYAAHWASVLRSHQTGSMALACHTVPDWIILQRIDDVAALLMPLYILAIDGDPVHPLELAQRMAAANPRARLTVVTPASDYTENAEKVGRLCRSFLDSL